MKMITIIRLFWIKKLNENEIFLACINHFQNSNTVNNLIKIPII